jgi:hypothetical protein
VAGVVTVADSAEKGCLLLLYRTWQGNVELGQKEVGCVKVKRVMLNWGGKK